MLDWIKRIKPPVSREPSIKSDLQPPPNDGQIDRLVGRIGMSTVAASEYAPGSGRMRVVVVASQKGGVGKTTIAAHLAVRADMMGEGPVVLIDTDPQGSLSEWWDARVDELASKEEQTGDGTLSLARVKLDDLEAKLAELRRDGVGVAIIDTPPALTASINGAITLADLVIIPARPSPHDLRAIGATVNMTRKAGKPFVFVVNGAAPRANITAEAVAALSEHGRVAPVILYQRTDYAASMIDGHTVLETVTASRSTQEIADLWKHIYGQMNMRVAA
jgi:chromosome partitioning protein